MLVTLKSTTHDNGISTDESASNWTNFFKEGIHFSPASTVQVVSCSINKTDDFIIERGVNDQFLYAIGKTGPLPPYAQGPFSQHRITIPTGGYTGTTLAAKIQQLLKNSTTLGTMKETWAVYYNPAGATTPANFMIEWNQLTPAIPYDLDNYQPTTEPNWRFLYPGAPASIWVREVIQLAEPNTIHAKLDQDRLTFNDLGGDDNIGIGGLISDGTDILGVNLPNGTIHAGEGNIVLTVPPTNIIGQYGLSLVRDAPPPPAAAPPPAIDSGVFSDEPWWGGGVFTATGTPDQYIFSGSSTGNDGNTVSVSGTTVTWITGYKVPQSGPFENDQIVWGATATHTTSTWNFTSSTPPAPPPPPSGSAPESYMLTVANHPYTPALNGDYISVGNFYRDQSPPRNFKVSLDHHLYRRDDGPTTYLLFSYGTGTAATWYIAIHGSVLPANPDWLNENSTSLGQTAQHSIGTGWNAWPAPGIGNYPTAAYSPSHTITATYTPAIVGVALATNEITLNNWLGVGQPVLATVDEVDPSLYNGYEYSMEVPNTDTGTINVLTPLAGVDGLRSLTIPVGQGGSNWQVNAIGTVIPFAGPGGGPGAGASFKVLTVDEDDTMGPPTLALLTVAVQLPGVNYVVGNTIELVNPAAPAGTNAIATVSAVREFTGDNLDVDAVLNLVNVSALGPWGDDQAKIQILTVGAGGIYGTSQFWTRGATYTAGQIVYAANPSGNNPYFTVTSVMDGFDVWFAHVTEEGAMGMVPWDYPHDATIPLVIPDGESNHSSWWQVGFKLGGDENFPNVLIDGTGTFLYEINLFETTGPVGHLFGNGPPNVVDPTAIWIGDDTNQLLPLAFTTIYPTSQVGYTRFQLRNVYTQDDADLYVSLVTTSDNLDVVVEIRQLQMIGNSFPNGTMILIGSYMMSVEMPLFTMGDWLSLAIKIDNYTNVSVVLSHDTQGNNVWLDNTIADTNSLDPVPNQLVPARTTWESNLRECMYPLRPIINTNIGTGFDPTSLPRAADIVDGMATPYFSAMVDAKNVDQYSHFKWEYDHSTLVTGTSMDDSEFEPVPIPVAGTPLLPWFYKFSQLRDLDISDAIDRDDSQSERALWDGLVDPNTANTGKTLAMFDVYNFDNAPSIDGLISSDPDKYPQPDTRNPTIQIELPDFGIKSFSGASHDTGRAIAAIPREQFTTDERSGTLHYESNYPVVINLNCKDDIVLNHMSCRMRQLDGKLAVLQNPTQVTILIKDNEESVQSRAYEKALDRMEQKKADRESNRIANMNYNDVPIM